MDPSLEPDFPMKVSINLITKFIEKGGFLSLHAPIFLFHSNNDIYNFFMIILYV